jgi:hypothetical protein
MANIYDMNEGMRIIGEDLDEAVEERTPDKEILPLPMPALQEFTQSETTSPAATSNVINVEILKKNRKIPD